MKSRMNSGFVDTAGLIKFAFSNGFTMRIFHNKSKPGTDVTWEWVLICLKENYYHCH